MKNLYLEIDTLANQDFEPGMNAIMGDARDQDDVKRLAARDGWAETVQNTLRKTGETATLAGFSFGFEAPDPSHALHPYVCDSGWVGMPAGSGPITEEKLINGFWKLAVDADRIITYGRYQIPFLLIRSAILGIKPKRQLYNMKPWDYTVVDLSFHRWQGSLIKPSLEHCLKLNSPLWRPGFLKQEEVNALLATEDVSKYDALKAHGKAKIEGIRSLADLWAGYFYPLLQPIG